VNSAIARPSLVRTATRVTPLRPAVAASSASAISVSLSAALPRKTIDACGAALSNGCCNPQLKLCHFACTSC
jgi:hypothetical protein